MSECVNSCDNNQAIHGFPDSLPDSLLHEYLRIVSQNTLHTATMFLTLSLGVFFRAFHTNSMIAVMTASESPTNNTTNIPPTFATPREFAFES